MATTECHRTSHTHIGRDKPSPTPLCLLHCLPPARAEPRLAHVFQDNMVLQRQMPVPVWGWADAGESVTVRFAEREKMAMAGDDGYWKVDLPPMESAAEGWVLEAIGEDGSIKRQNVLVGEVWVAAGQSNMNTGIRRAREYFEDDSRVAMAELYDLGDDQTHFHQKNQMGRRYGLAALEVAYGQDHVYTGPLAADKSIEGSRAVVSFTHAAGPRGGRGRRCKVRPVQDPRQDEDHRGQGGEGGAVPRGEPVLIRG